jgi:hypothetical protein
MGPTQSRLFAKLLSALVAAGCCPVLVSCSGSMGEPPPAGLTFKQIVMIDDMEDGDQYVKLPNAENQGNWVAFADMTTNVAFGTWLASDPHYLLPPQPDGTMDPNRGVWLKDGQAIKMLPLDQPHPLWDGEAASTKGLHIAGAGFRIWGAGWEITLNTTDPQPTQESFKYDVTPYTGITFWARTGAPSATNLKVSFTDLDTQPNVWRKTDPEKKRCVDDALAPLAMQCWDDFAKTITLTSEWRQFAIPFSELAQGGYGYKPPLGFDPTTVYVIKFAFPQYFQFDVWLDDLAFYVK